MLAIKQTSMNKCIIIGACAAICLAVLVRAQYNTYDSESNSGPLIRSPPCLSLDSDENPILAKTELGKLVRNSAKLNQHHRNNINANQQYQQQLASATRNLYNRQQPMQYAPTHNRRQYGNAAELNGYGPMMGAGPRNGYSGGSNNEANDDEESSAFGPNYNSNSNNNDDDAEGGAAPINLNQAASGYPGVGQGDYGANDASGAGAGFNFGGVSGYGPSADGSEFGPSGDAFSGEGRRHKSASAPTSSRNYGSDDELAGALQYGPNSAINSGGDGDEENSRAGYAPEAQNDNDNDDE